jgi:hypothetical protein
MQRIFEKEKQTSVIRILIESFVVVFFNLNITMKSYIIITTDDVMSEMSR